MNRVPLYTRYWSPFVDRVADDIDDSPESAFADRDRDWPARVDGFHSTDHSIGRKHGDSAYTTLAEMVLDLTDNIDWLRNVEPVAYDAQRLVNWGKLRLLELDIDDWADDLNYFTEIPAAISRAAYARCHNALLLLLVTNPDYVTNFTNLRQNSLPLLAAF